MSHPIEDYAIIGDTRTTALIHQTGSIDWLCWPRHDSPALLLRLLDDGKGGFSEVTFDEQGRIERRYLPGTNILETTFETRSGTAMLLDFMPLRASEPAPATGPDGVSESSIVRIVTCTAGRISGAFLTRPTFDYARKTADVSRAGATCRFACDQEILVVHGDCEPDIEGGDSACWRFELGAGQASFLVLHYVAPGAALDITASSLDLARVRLEETRHYWEAWSARCTYDGAYRDAVLRSILVLKLLTYAPTGAIIAAPTLGLPEAVPGNRNYDYRYSWLRDASFTVTSFLRLGYVREASEYLRFLREIDESQGANLRLLYTIEGGSGPMFEHLPHLAGWRDVSPVTIGNEAVDQIQTDIYGEFLSALDAWLEAVGEALDEGTRSDLKTLVSNLAQNAMAVRDVPDNGIWELRTGRAHNLHSRAMVYVALDRAARIGERLGLSATSIARWRSAAVEVRREYETRAWNDTRRTYAQSYGSEVLDAAVMRVLLFDALDARDDRVHLTLYAIERDLAQEDLVYRYRMPDGLAGAEATFTACAFWRVGALALSGRLDVAKRLFERLLTRANDVGLYAEEIDATTDEHRGNFPQAFTHMAVINHATRLERLLTDRRTPTLN